VEAVHVELASGPIEHVPAAAEVRWTFVADETRAFAVWPQSIFDEGLWSRYAIVVDSPGEIWTAWRHQTAMREP